MGRAILTAVLAGLVLGACAEGTGAGTDALPGTEADCAAAGGRWGAGGILGHEMCVLTTPDAGAACATSDDCTGFCLAETRSCSAVTPMFGCFALIEADGAEVAMCID